MRHHALAFLLLATACKPATPSTAAAPEVPMTAPDAEQRPYTHVEHGVERDDPYHWMRFKEDPAVIAYLEAENAYQEAQTAHLADLRKGLFDELLGRIQEDDTSAPVQRGDWWYYTRTEAGKPYPIHCRKQGDLDAPEQVYLDVNVLAEGLEYLDVGGMTVSPDHRILAYATDTTGREKYDLRFRDLSTGEDLPDVIEDIWPDLAWATDGKTVLYTRLDDSLRPHQAVRHVLGTPAADDALVYEEADSRFRVGVSRTRDDAWLLLQLDSATTSEVRTIPADAPDAEPTVFSARHEGMEYAVASQGDRWLVLTNDANDADGKHTDDALNFWLAEAAPGATDRTSWTPVVPHRDDVTLMDVDAFAGHLVLWEREQGLTHLRLLARDGRDTRIPMPEPVYVLSGSANPNFDSGTYRFGYTSLTVPATTYQADLATLDLTVLKQQGVLGGFDADDYVAERLWVDARDGTKVPVSLVHRKDTPVDGTAPMLLYGYGAYGITIEPWFSSARLSLLDRGVIYAIAHVRGGGFLGRTWKENGKFEHKQNSFSDFVDVGRALHAKGYSTPERTAIQGGSAGGLLMGAVINQAPDLAAAAVAQVPFVDVVSTMLDASIPLTTNEWEEWGDPREKAWFDVMLAYSPYDNVRNGPYPDLLITSGLNDPRVQYWEPTKWIARLRDRVTNDAQILMKMEMGTGHGGRSGRYGRLEDTAFVYAWLLERWGLADEG